MISRTFERAAFLFAIAVVVGMFAEKQVAGAHAQPIVALMADHHPIWNRPDAELIGNTVCLTVPLSLAPEAEIAVTAEIHGTKPIPATRSFSDFRPEAIRERCDEVIGANAELIAAFRKSPDGSEFLAREHQRIAMGEHVLFTIEEDAPPGAGFRASPNPASPGFADLHPEQFYPRFVRAWHGLLIA